MDLGRVRTVREEAALRGYFDPASLVSSLPADTQTEILSQLRPLCSIETRGVSRQWLLERSERREVLSELAGNPKALEERLSRLRLPEADRLGRILRQALRGESPDFERVKAARLRHLLTVSDWLDGIVEEVPATARVRQEVSSRALKAELKTLVGRGLLGRAREMRKLQAFVEAEPPSEVSVIEITGIGGAGKSTLLAAFALSLKRQERVAVIYLDFDRPDLSDGNTTNMLFELTRQLGFAFPAIADKLRKFRQDARETSLFHGDDMPVQGVEADVRSSSELVYQFRSHPR